MISGIREIIEQNPPVSENELLLFEEENCLRLPIDYRSFLLSSNGGRPIPSAFPIIGFPNNPFGNLQLFFGVNDPCSSTNLEDTFRMYVDQIPYGILPIACTDCDDFICLDMRLSPAAVKFWFRKPFWGNGVWREKFLYPVSEDFKTFLGSFQP